jgi:hypothetical protein
MPTAFTLVRPTPGYSDPGYPPRRLPAGPREPAPKTGRRHKTRTVDGVRLVPFGAGYRLDGSWIGMERLDGRRWTVVVAHLPNDHPDHTLLATTLARAIRRLRSGGHIPKAGA